MIEQLRVRRGLPRSPGGHPWPPDRPVPAAANGTTSVPFDTKPADAAPGFAVPATSSDEAAAVASRVVRRGLPRIPGGAPWPPASGAPTPDAGDLEAGSSTAGSMATGPSITLPPTTGAGPQAITTTVPTRRGLPRTAGGDPWPPDRPAPAARPTPPAPAVSPSTAPESTDSAADGAVAGSPDLPPDGATAGTADSPRPISTERRSPDPGGSAAPRLITPEREPSRYHGRTAKQWLAIGVAAAAGLAALLLVVVLVTRWFLSLDFMTQFVSNYPGEYELPESAPVGLPGWLGWQHFLNSFFLLLIIRTGIQVRSEKRPSAYWTARWANDSKRRISLTLWLHQALDILWLANGLLFAALLFATGQWMRIVPTSWAVFPNALSAVLQYLSLDWPTENGWINYNSLQQLAYFTIVFIAAPLAALSGFRMSGAWPKRAGTLSRLIPVEAARAVHFPVMLFFCLFIVVHVALVLATGALRNLNHMYAAQDAISWTGFWIFLVSIAIMTAGWFAARPLIVAPLAGLFGRVSSK